MNKFDEMREALDDYDACGRALDAHVRNFVRAIRGRLRKMDAGKWSADHDNLCALKKELANYNMQTGKWKE